MPVKRINEVEMQITNCLHKVRCIFFLTLEIAARVKRSISFFERMIKVEETNFILVNNHQASASLFSRLQSFLGFARFSTSLETSLNFLRLRSGQFQNRATILKLTSLGVNLLGMLYTLFAKSLMS